MGETALACWITNDQGENCLTGSCSRSSSFEPAGMSKRLKFHTRSASLQEAGQSEIEMFEHGTILHIWN